MSDKGEDKAAHLAPSEEQDDLLTIPKERHTFKAPAPKTSLLGLDRLAAQKRAEQAKQGSILGAQITPSLFYIFQYSFNKLEFLIISLFSSYF